MIDRMENDLVYVYTIANIFESSLSGASNSVTKSLKLCSLALKSRCSFVRFRQK